MLPAHVLGQREVQSYFPVITETKSEQQSIPTNFSPAFQSVCRNWALHFANKNQITLEVAYERIFGIITKNTPNVQLKQDLVLALEQRNWENPLFANLDEFPYYALAALNEGLLSIEQFTTLMFYRMTVLYHKNAKDVRSIPLFVLDEAKNPKVNPVARDLIQRTLRPVESIINPIDPEIERLDKAKGQLSDAEIDAFFEKMLSKPISEQQFFFVPDIQEAAENYEQAVDDMLNQKRTISIEIKDSVGINVFNRFVLNSNKGQLPKKTRMIPSLSMMQTFLDVKFSDPVKINPVICLSPLEALRQNARERQRELGITFPGIKLPAVADNLLAPAYDFPYHDFYHAIIASGVPQNQIEGFLILVEILEEMSKDPKWESIKHLISGFAERVLDMEKTYYRQDSTYKVRYPGFDDSRFWASLSLDLLSTHNHIALAEYVKTQTPISETFRKNFIAICSTTFFESFVIEIIKRQEDFKNKKIEFTHFLAAAIEEEDNIRTHIESSPASSPFAFNQEDDFQTIKSLSMLARWRDFLLNKDESSIEP